jgi:hypothetical protein
MAALGTATLGAGSLGDSSAVFVYVPAQTPGYRAVVSAGQRGNVMQGVMSATSAGDMPRAQAGSHADMLSGRRTGSY